jgi:hypothetical protein
MNPEIEIDQMDVDALAALGLIEHSAVRELRAELAAEREKIEALNRKLDDSERIHTTAFNGVVEALAAAQATIAQMREALKIVAQSHAWTQFGECRSFGSDAPLLNPSDADRLAHKALALQTNQDALHEALARECERLAVGLDMGDTTRVFNWLQAEATAHRARKETE